MSYEETEDTIKFEYADKELEIDKENIKEIIELPED